MRQQKKTPKTEFSLGSEDGSRIDCDCIFETYKRQAYRANLYCFSDSSGFYGLFEVLTISGKLEAE